MKLTIDINRNEIQRLLGEAFPLTFELSSETLEQERRSVTICKPEDVEFVPGRGIEMTCSMTIHWPLPIMPDEVDIHELRAFIIPEIENRESGASVVFRFQIEELDVKLLPKGIDKAVANQIDKMLIENDTCVRWHLTNTFSLCLGIPDRIEPPSNIDISVDDAQLDITNDAMLLQLPVHLSVVRGTVREATINAALHPDIELVGVPKNMPALRLQH